MVGDGPFTATVHFFHAETWFGHSSADTNMEDIKGENTTGEIVCSLAVAETVFTPPILPPDDPAAEHRVAVVKNRALPRRDRSLRFVECDRRAFLLHPDRCGRAIVMVSDAHVAGEFIRGWGTTHPTHFADRHLSSQQIVVRADCNDVGFDVDVCDINGMAERHPESPSLADGVKCGPAMASDRTAVRGHDVPFGQCARTGFSGPFEKKPSVVIAGNEADFLAFLAFRGGEAPPSGKGDYLFLGDRAKRKQRP